MPLLRGSLFRGRLERGCSRCRVLLWRLAGGLVEVCKGVGGRTWTKGCIDAGCMWLCWNLDLDLDLE